MRKRVAYASLPQAKCTECCYLMVLMALSLKNYEKIPLFKKHYAEALINEKDDLTISIK